MGSAAKNTTHTLAKHLERAMKVKVSLAEFGDLHDIEAKIKRAVPEVAFPRVSNDLSGCIAVLDSHPDCAFAIQARNAQVAGAVGVIIVNTSGTNRKVERFKGHGVAPSTRSGRSGAKSAFTLKGVATSLSSAARLARLSSTTSPSMPVTEEESKVEDAGKTSPAKAVSTASLVLPAISPAAAAGGGGGAAGGSLGPAGGSTSDIVRLPPIARSSTSGSTRDAASRQASDSVEGKLDGDAVRGLRAQMREKMSLRAAVLAVKALAGLKTAPVLVDKLSTLIDPGDAVEVAEKEGGKSKLLRRKSSVGNGVMQLKRMTSSSALKASTLAVHQRRDDARIKQLVDAEDREEAEEEKAKEKAKEKAAAEEGASAVPEERASASAPVPPPRAGAPKTAESVEVEGDPIFSMPLDVDGDQFEISIPVMMVHASDKRKLVDGNECVLRLVEDDAAHAFHTWPFNYLSIQQVQEDVTHSWLCMSNLLRASFLTSSHLSLAVASRLQDPATWTHGQLLEALAKDKWSPMEGKKYQTKELVSEARLSRCRPPQTMFQKRLLVKLVEGEHLNKPLLPQMLNQDSSLVNLFFASSKKTSPAVAADVHPVWNHETWFPVCDSAIRDQDLASCRARFDHLSQEPPRESTIRGKVVAIYLVKKVFSDVKIFYEPHILVELAESADSGGKKVLPWLAMIAIYEGLLEQPLDILKLEVVSESPMNGSKVIGAAEVDLSDFVVNVWEDVRVILSTPEDAGDQIMGSDGAFSALHLRVCIRSLALPLEVNLDQPEVVRSPERFPDHMLNTSQDDARARARRAAIRALEVVLASDAIRADLQRALMLGFEQFPQSIVLRYFEPKVAASPQRHFRCFVYDNALTCISQRHCACYFAELIGDLAEIQRHIVAFFWTHVQNRMRQAHREHYVFDIFVGYKPEPDKPDQAKSGASASVAGSVMTNAASLKSASAKAATIRAFSSGQAPSVAASEPSAPELSGPIEAIDASAIIRHEREYAGLDEEDDEDLLHADLGAVLILEVLPFDTRVDGCLFDWGNPADRTVLESGEVMVAGERQFVSLPGNMVVPSATIRVLQMPPDNVLESLPPLWQHHAANTFKDTKFDEDIDPDIMGESTPHSSSPSKLNQDKTAASSLRHMERTATANFHREGSQPTVAPRSKGCVVM